jgi:hypothetical protein
LSEEGDACVNQSTVGCRINDNERGEEEIEVYTTRQLQKSERERGDGREEEKRRMEDKGWKRMR